MAQNKAQREWYQRNRHEMIKHRKENPRHYRDVHLRRHYGIGIEAYEVLLETQQGVCAICGKAASGDGYDKHLQVDHCHDTGRIRGLLCHKCNKAIGLLKDSVDLVQKACRYLGGA